MMAASVIVTIPVLILFTIVQKQIIEGLVGEQPKDNLDVGERQVFTYKEVVFRDWKKRIIVGVDKV